MIDEQVPDSSSSTPSPQEQLIITSGIMEITEKGYGFLRQSKNDYRATPGDPFVGKDFVRHGGLRTGLLVEGKSLPPNRKKGGP